MPAPAIGVDETSFAKRHRYVTVVNDMSGHVLHVDEGRRQRTLDNFFRARYEACLAQLKMDAMDMWPAYIASVRSRTRAAIAFDKFHVLSHIGRAMDQVRRTEHRELSAQGDRRLTGTKHFWLTAPSHLDPVRRGLPSRGLVGAGG